MRRLLIRPGAIGDSILGFPALEHLCSDDTEVWVRSEVVPLVGFARRVRSLASTGLSMLEIDPPPHTLASLASFDEIWSWHGAANPAFRDAVARFPFRFLPALPPGDGSVHAADFFASSVGAPLPAVPRIPIDAPRHGAIAVHPFSGSPKKNWPRDRFVELSRRLPVEWAHDRFDNLLGLARWLAGASLFIGNDSGITHLAAAVGTPVLALFGPTDPAVWAPRGPNVHILRAPTLDEITVDQVIREAESIRVTIK